MGPHAFTHITPNEMVFETDSRLASKYGTLKITDRLRSRTGMWSGIYGVKETSQRWSEKKKRTEILHVPKNTMVVIKRN